MNRRSFLVAMGAAWIVGCSGSGDPMALPFGPKQRKAVQALGQAAATAASLPSGEEALRNALTEHASLAGVTGQAEVVEALCKQIEADFAADQIVSVAGWQLAHTEALVAALLATA